MERTTLETVPAVFEKFSVKQLGQACGVARYGTAYAWKEREKFPMKHYFPMIEFLESHGYTAPKSLWGMK